MSDKHIQVTQVRPPGHVRGRTQNERRIMEDTQARLVRAAYLTGLSVKKFSAKAAEELGVNPSLIQRVCGGREYRMCDQPELDRVITKYSTEKSHAE